MRTLTAALQAAQQATTIDALVKINLVPFNLGGEGDPGQDPEYGRERILKAEMTLQPYSQKAKVTLDNSDGALNNEDLKSYAGYISFGAITSEGEEYAAQPPMVVMGQEFESAEGKLVCVLDLVGIPDLMAKDKASGKHAPDDTDTATVKSLVNAIAGATLAPYTHCVAYSVDWDSEDNLINTLQPKDAFRIYVGDDRLSKIRELLEYTGCHMRAEADGHLHIFVPVTTGETYDYQYSLTQGVPDGHSFFSKAYRNRLVIPNKVTVTSQEDDEPQYSGSSVASPSYELLPIEEFKKLRVSGSLQASVIALAMINRYKMWCDSGKSSVPLNVGQEVLDYILVTDERQGDSRAGNIGQIKIHYAATPSQRGRVKWEMEFSFGDWTTVPKVLEELGITPTQIQGYLSRLKVKDLYAENIKAENIDLSSVTQDDIGDGTTYKRVLSVHIDAGHIKLDNTIIYSPGYNPTTKFDPSVHTLDNVPEGASYKRVLSTDIQAGRIVLTDTGFLVKNSKVVGGSETGTRTELTANGLRGYNGTTLQFEIRANDGRAYAGGGAVILDANGITVTGQVLRISDGANTGYLYENAGVLTLANTGNVRLYPAAGVVDIQADVLPSANGSYDLGASSWRWSSGYINWLYSYYLIGQAGGNADFSAMNWLDLPQRASAPVGYNGRCYFNTGDLHPYVYDSGSWKAFGNAF